MLVNEAFSFWSPEQWLLVLQKILPKMPRGQVQSQSGTGKTCVFSLGALQSVGGSEGSMVERETVRHQKGFISKESVDYR